MATPRNGSCDLGRTGSWAVAANVIAVPDHRIATIIPFASFSENPFQRDQSEEKRQDRPRVPERDRRIGIERHLGRLGQVFEQACRPRAACRTCRRSTRPPGSSSGSFICTALELAGRGLDAKAWPSGSARRESAAAASVPRSRPRAPAAALPRIRCACRHLVQRQLARD